jgi:dTDP-4-dehydrorhamnose 3,5-epimerase
MTSLPGCCELQPQVRRDARGTFVKVFEREAFRSLDLRTDFAEEYYSTSLQGVLRGMHFQVPPYEHAKLVYCVHGSVLDAVIDLRRGSPTFGHYTTLDLSAAHGNALYVPAGLAHGFYVLSEVAIMVYMVTSSYAPAADKGVRWDSVPIPWPVSNPVLSERDRDFPLLKDWESPFIWKESAR